MEKIIAPDVVERMSPITTSLIVCACVFGGAVLGMFLRRVLPEHHLNADSKSTVNLGIGLIGTMSGIALGLLVASAASKYDTQKNEVTKLSADFVLIDRILAHYGSETEESRDLLRGTVVRMLDRFWPQDRSQHAHLEPTATRGEVVYEEIQQLSPQDDGQRYLKAQALTIAMDVGQTRWLMYEQGNVPLPRALLVIVVFWLTIVFTCFGLFAPRNPTVVGVLFLCALSVSGAIFLILELYTPFGGLIQVSSAPLRDALAQLGR
jgi:hypothetical protein